MTNETGYILSRALKNYDGKYGSPLNLGLGTPPIGMAPELIEPLANRQSGQEIVHYSPDPLHAETQKMLIDGLGLKNINPENVVFNGNGSYGAGDEVVRFLSLEGHKTIYVSNYSFPNVSQWAVRHGVSYMPVESRNLNPIGSFEKLMTMDEKDFKDSMVYIDYPNNPLGIANGEIARSVIVHCSNNGAVPIVDLAFGEVLGSEYADITQFTLDKGGITLGSITKTQGGAKARAGWSIMAPKFTNNGYSGEQRMVFGLNDEAEFMLKLLLTKSSDGGRTLAQIHAERVAIYNKETNIDFYNV